GVPAREEAAHATRVLRDSHPPRPARARRGARRGWGNHRRPRAGV
ncbi:MAG: hypothetical protein AVDCRST_MAG33-2120, partial [uncultured Thermomicrobiales bacterium]